MRLALAALVAFALLPAAAQAAQPVTETASAGAVTATFTHRDAGDGRWTDMKVSIARGGVPVYGATPKVPGCAAPYCAPYGVLAQEPAIRVLDVTGDGEPEVLVDFYSGGAHCCEITGVWRWTGTTYKPLWRTFADAGYTLAPVTPAAPGVPTPFVTADARFAYEFASFADSAFPVRILTIEDGRWSDQTAAHLDSVRADAARLLKAYTKRRNGRRALGLLAAWVADEYVLAHEHRADAFVAHELRAGRLKTLEGWPGGKAFVKVLHRDLRRWGYVVRRGAAL